jgi:hypothetical protein
VAITNHGEALLTLVGSGIEAWSADDPRQQIARIELPADQKFVAMSPGDEIVTSGPCGTVAWDWRTGSAVWAQPFQVDRITWDNAGAIAAAIGPGALWRVWRTDTGETLCAAPPAPAIRSRAFSPDGLMALGYNDGTVELRDADAGEPRRVATPPEASGGIVTALGRGGRALAVVTGANTSAARLVVVDIGSGSAIGALPLQYGAYAVSLSADGRRVAFANAAPVLHDVVSGGRLLDAGAGSNLLGFDPDDQRVAIVASADAEVVHTYHVSDGSPAGDLVAPPGVSIRSLAADWSVALGTQSSGFGEQLVWWAFPGGPVQPIPWSRNFAGPRLSSDGQLLFQSGIYYHEFTGDYPALAIFDLGTASELAFVINHALSPSANGRHLFGQAGALFCR